MPKKAVQVAKAVEATAIGMYVFVLALLIAIVAGLIPTAIEQTPRIVLLGILGIVIGLLNVTAKEAGPFLLAAIAFILSMGALGEVLTPLPYGDRLTDIVKNIRVIVAPAAFVVALKAIYDIARTR